MSRDTIQYTWHNSCHVIQFITLDTIHVTWYNSTHLTQFMSRDTIHHTWHSSCHVIQFITLDTIHARDTIHYTWHNSCHVIQWTKSAPLRQTRHTWRHGTTNVVIWDVTRREASLHMTLYDIFDNCNWVATQWQQLSTHLRTNSTQNDTKQYIEQHKNLGRARAVPRLCGFYPGICLTTEENARKNISQGSRRAQLG
jgi:hypothetical protein